MDNLNTNVSDVVNLVILLGKYHKHVVSGMVTPPPSLGSFTLLPGYREEE